MKPKTYLAGFIILLALGLVTLTIILIVTPSANTTDENGTPYPSPLPSPTPTPVPVLAPPLNTSETFADDVFLSLEWQYDRVNHRVRVTLHNNTSNFGISHVDFSSFALAFNYFDGEDWYITPREEERLSLGALWGIVSPIFPGGSRVIATICPASWAWGSFFPLPHDALHRIWTTIWVVELPEGWHEPYVYEGHLRFGPSPIRREDLDHDVYIEFYWPQAHD